MTAKPTGRLPADDVSDVNRRRFLTYAVAAVGAFVGGSLATALGGLFAYPAFLSRPSNWVDLGEADRYPEGVPTLAEFDVLKRDAWIRRTERKSVWVLRAGAQFTVYNPQCTHLGCIVSWLPDRRVFRSPCHNGIFAPDGAVLGGPPPRPLDRLEYRTQDGRLVVSYREFRLGIPEKVEV